jgi:uncharacterized RDD family membrane protein YckC
MGMGQQWYYTQSGAQAGPVSTDVLRQMFAAGQLGPDELVWSDGMPDWQRARDVPTFFAPPAPQPQPQRQAYYPPQQPYAGHAGAFPSPYGAAPAPAPINYYAPQTYVQYAGFWLRFCALFIDYVIVWIGTFVVGFAVGFAIVGAGGRIDDGVTILLQLFGVVLVWLYFALQESSAAQATLGKRALGLKVTDGYGNRISFGRATGRHFGKILSGLILGIGYIMAAFTERKQALHDIMAETLVLKNPPMR